MHHLSGWSGMTTVFRLGEDKVCRALSGDNARRHKADPRVAVTRRNLSRSVPEKNPLLYGNRQSGQYGHARTDPAGGVPAAEVRIAVVGQIITRHRRWCLRLYPRLIRIVLAGEQESAAANRAPAPASLRCHDGRFVVSSCVSVFLLRRGFLRRSIKFNQIKYRVSDGFLTFVGKVNTVAAAQLDSAAAVTG